VVELSNSAEQMLQVSFLDVKQYVAFINFVSVALTNPVEIWSSAFAIEYT
jgi:hypothetical protein